MGSKIIEKHFTLNKNWKGADHELSADPKDMTMICNFAKNYKELMGNGVIEPSIDEKKMRKFFRKSLFAKKNMLVGEKINIKNIEGRRPVTFIKSEYLSKVINKKVKKKIDKDEPIKKHNIQ